MRMVHAKATMQILAEKMRELEQDYARLRAKLEQAEEMFRVIQSVQIRQTPQRDGAEDKRADTGQ
jgi:hypothetical protein